MNFNANVSTNKAIEIIVFERAWPSVIDLTIEWTLKNHGRDHWGFLFCFVLFGWKVLEFNFYDIRHQEDGNEW